MSNLLSKQSLTPSERTQALTLANRHLAQANLFKSQLNFRAAIREFLSAVPYLSKAHSDDSAEAAEGFLGLGECAERVDEHPGAEEEGFAQVLKVLEPTPQGLGLHPVDPSHLPRAREGMARVLEKEGKLLEARKLRLRGAGEGNGRCSYYKCEKFPLALESLNACGGCRCAFYCSTECQKSDWPRHKAPCKTYGAGAKAQIQT